MTSWLKRNCKFAQLKVEYLYVGSEDNPIDQELLDEAWAIAKTSGINILRNQDLYTIAVLNGHAVGALFVSSTGPTYSFDVVVHPKYQRQGIGFELAKIGNGLQYEDGFEEQFPEGLKHNIASPGGERIVEKLRSQGETSLSSNTLMKSSQKQVLPDVWYHGEKGASESKIYSPMYFSNSIERATGYAKSQTGGSVLKARLRFKNPKIEKSAPMQIYSKEINYLQKEGHDALIQTWGQNDFDAIVLDLTIIEPISFEKTSSRFINSICKFAQQLNPNPPEPLSGDIETNPTLKKDTIPSLAEIEASWDARGIQNAMHEKGGVITLHKIIVPKEQRGSGIGTAAMQELIDYADKTGQQIALSPSKDFGGNKARLESFYRGFGFRKYKGFAFRETMVRDPQSKPSPAIKRQFVLNICKFAQQQKLLDFDPPETFSGDIESHPELKKKITDTTPEGMEEEEYIDGFYHVTTNLPAVLQWGALKSRKQLGGNVPGLGGGEANEAWDKISLTHSLDKANTIFHGLLYAAKICSNQLATSHIFDSTLSEYNFPDDFLMESDVKDFLENWMTPEEMGEDGENIDQLLDQRIKAPKEKYDFLTRLEAVLNTQMENYDTSFAGPPVGLTVPFETFCQLNPKNIAILKMQVRKGAPYQHVPEELELRLDADDVRLADDAVVKRA